MLKEKPKAFTCSALHSLYTFIKKSGRGRGKGQTMNLIENSYSLSWRLPFHRSMEISDLVKILILVSQHGWLSHSMAGHKSPGPYLMSLSQGTGIGKYCVISFLVTMHKLSWLVWGGKRRRVSKKRTLEVLLQQELKSAEKKEYYHKKSSKYRLGFESKAKKIVRTHYYTASHYIHQFR